VLLEDILITEVVLPKGIREAIANKLREAQLVQEYAYRVQRERLESERKAEEAEGIRRFQQIVAANLSPAYLRWRGIEATSELARSPNSKVVVVGNAQTGGLPLILDTNGQSGEPPARPSAKHHPAHTAPKPPAERTAAPPRNK
jgi:regulator of protease activity HflC (stomatin/prohibitin superfamily)